VPPVVVVATIAAELTFTCVEVDAAEVVTADPALSQFVPSLLICSCTLPALTPDEVVTIIVATSRVAKPSSTTGVADVADTPLRETAGAMPRV
jgi:hypothetical protein